MLRELKKRYNGIVVIEGCIPGKEAEVFENNFLRVQELTRKLDIEDKKLGN